MTSGPTEFIPAAGACIASRNVLEERARLRFCLRQESADAIDTGWRFFSEIDSQAYVDDPSNMEVADYNRICEIEPAAIPLWNLPLGSDIEIVRDPDGRKRIRDAATGEFLDLSGG